MKDTAQRFDLSNYIPCQLASLTQTMTRSIAALLDERYGISLPEWKVLAIIRDKPGQSAVAVARHAQMDTVAVSRAVTKLLDSGLVSRELDSEDRRCSVLGITAEGQELHDQIAPLACELETSLLNELSEEEVRVFTKAVRLLHSKAQIFTDAYSAPSRRHHAPMRNTNGRAVSDRFRPLRTGPILTARV